MFSFGGFSSIIPYIGYLSLMWICILIGICGHLKGVFGILTPLAQTIESVTSVEKETFDLAFFEKRVTKNPVKKEGLFATYLFYRFQSLSWKKIAFFEHAKIFRHQDFINACGLRARPNII